MHQVITVTITGGSSAPWDGTRVGMQKCFLPNTWIFLGIFFQTFWPLLSKQWSEGLPLPSSALTHPLHTKIVIPEESEQLQTGYTFMSRQHPEPRQEIKPCCVYSQIPNPAWEADAKRHFRTKAPQGQVWAVCAFPTLPPSHWKSRHWHVLIKV